MKSLNHIWSIVCSKSLLDKDSNNVSLINTIEKITLPISEVEMRGATERKSEGFLFQFEFEVVSRLMRKIKGPIAFDYRVILLSPSGKKLIVSERRLAMDPDIKNLRVRTNFGTLPIEKSGDCILEISIKDVEEQRYEVVSEIPVEVALNVISDNTTNKKTA